MIIASILTEITNYIKSIEEEVNYENWHVSLSRKETQQFEYDTMIAMNHTKRIDKIDSDLIEELIKSLKDMGIDTVTEKNGTIIYVYKTLV